MILPHYRKLPSMPVSLRKSQHLQISDADPAIHDVAQLRTLIARLSAAIVDLDDRLPVTVTIIDDPDYHLLAELAISDTPVAVIPVYNFDDYVPMIEDHSVVRDL